MASGSVKRLDVCKEADTFAFNLSVKAGTRARATANAAGYVIPAGYVSAVAGITGETTTSNNATPFNFISPRAVGTDYFISFRSNGTTKYTRNISVKMTFVKTEYVDDRRT